MRDRASARLRAPARMRDAVALTLVGLALSAAPAAAITAEVAKKCREVAVRAHPPQPAGTKNFAQAEREAFRDCVAQEEKQPPRP